MVHRTPLPRLSPRTQQGPALVPVRPLPFGVAGFFLLWRAKIHPVKVKRQPAQGCGFATAFTIFSRATRPTRINPRFSTPVFGITSQTLDALFRKYRGRAGLAGFTLHDSRHTAATRLALSGKVQALELCAIMGWKNPRQAMVYFNPTASQLAARLG